MVRRAMHSWLHTRPLRAMAAETEQDKKDRAEQIRRQIEKLKSGDDVAEDEPKRKKGESPKEYLERREREIERLKKRQQPDKAE